MAAKVDVILLVATMDIYLKHKEHHIVLETPRWPKQDDLFEHTSEGGATVTMWRRHCLPVRRLSGKQLAISMNQGIPFVAGMKAKVSRVSIMQRNSYGRSKGRINDG